jgi:hypothetical protein
VTLVEKPIVLGKMRRMLLCSRFLQKHQELVPADICWQQRPGHFCELKKEEDSFDGLQSNNFYPYGLNCQQLYHQDPDPRGWHDCHYVFSASNCGQSEILHEDPSEELTDTRKKKDSL